MSHRAPTSHGPSACAMNLACASHTASSKHVASSVQAKPHIHEAKSASSNSLTHQTLSPRS